MANERHVNQLHDIHDVSVTINDVVIAPAGTVRNAINTNFRGGEHSIEYCLNLIIGDFNRLADDMDKTAAQMQNDITTVKTTLSNAIATNFETLQLAITWSKQQMLNQLANESADFNTALGDYQIQVDTAIETFKANHTALLAQMQENYENAIFLYESNITNLMVAEQTRFEALINDWDTEVTELVQLKESQINAALAAAIQAWDMIQKSVNVEIIALDSQARNSLKMLKETEASHFNSTIQKYDQQIDDLLNTRISMLDTFLATADDKLSNKVIQLQADFTTFKNTWATTLNTRLNSAITAMNNQLDRLTGIIEDYKTEVLDNLKQIAFTGAAADLTLQAGYNWATDAEKARWNERMVLDDDTIYQYDTTGTATDVTTTMAALLAPTKTSDLVNDAGYITGTAPEIIVLKNVIVSTFEDSEVYTEYPKQGVITISGITANDYPEVFFDRSDSTSDNYSYVCSTAANTLYIYCKTIPSTTLTIPLILITRASGV